MDLHAKPSARSEAFASSETSDGSLPSAASRSLNLNGTRNLGGQVWWLCSKWVDVAGCCMDLLLGILGFEVSVAAGFEKARNRANLTRSSGKDGKQHTRSRNPCSMPKLFRKPP